MREGRFVARFWYGVVWCQCWVLCKVWFRYRWTGRSNVPMVGPALLVSNHQSHLDPVLVGVASPRQLRSLARQTLFVWPLGWLIRSIGAVPIDLAGSGIAGVRTTLKMLRDQEAVLLFPEGTRSRDGELQPLQAGFAALARRSGAAIVPVAIHGSFAALPRSSLWPRPRQIALAFGQPILPEEIAQQSDQQLVEQVRERISALLAEMN
jgi:1-acyl-sn-glycerol-3-phosphate acyltransferase